MKKSELTNGMHVITNNNEEFIVMSNIVADKQIADGNIATTLLIRIDNGGWLNLNSYDENLTELDGDWDFGIKAIYKPLYYYDVLFSVFDDYHNTNFVQVYGRRNMTQAEIEKELGYEINIIED